MDSDGAPCPPLALLCCGVCVPCCVRDCVRDCARELGDRMVPSMLCGPGCFGCSYCDEGWGDGDRSGALAGEEARKRMDAARRKMGRPTLFVSFGEILRESLARNGEKKKKGNGGSGHA